MKTDSGIDLPGVGIGPFKVASHVAVIDKRDGTIVAQDVTITRLYSDVGMADLSCGYGASLNCLLLLDGIAADKITSKYTKVQLVERNRELVRISEKQSKMLEIAIGVLTDIALSGESGPLADSYDYATKQYAKAGIKSSGEVK